jgi:putative DNA primase/helicase
MVQRFSSREAAVREALAKRKAACAGYQPQGYFCDTFEELRDRMGYAKATWTYRQPGVRQGTMVLMTSPTPQRNHYSVICQYEGRWYGSFPAPPYLLYQRYEWIDAETVYVCEGEKSADAVENLGFAATTSLGGPTMPERSDWSPLRGKQVVVLRDLDEKGRFYAEQVAQLCLGNGALSVRIVALPELKVDESVSEWLACEVELAGTEGARAEIEKCVANASPVQYVEPETKPPVGPRADVKCLSDVVSAPLEWVYGQVIPRGMLTLLIGEPGVGKSRIALDMVAAVTLGSTGGTRGVEERESGRTGLETRPTTLNMQEPSAVLLFSQEQSLADSICTRLQAAGADLSRIFALCGVREFDHETGDDLAWTFQLERDLPMLEAELRRLHTNGIAVRMIVIDPVDCYLGEANLPATNPGMSRILANKLAARSAMRTSNAPQPGGIDNTAKRLAELAAATGVAIVLVSHWSPLGAGCNGLNRLTLQTPVDGSYVFAARSVWMIASHLDDPKRRVLLPVKSELFPPPPGLACTIANDVVAWDDEPVPMTMDDYVTLSAERTRDRQPAILEARTELAYVIDWLKQRLSNGCVRAKTIQQDAVENLISMATLKRARLALKCDIKKESKVKYGASLWSLPKPVAATTAESGKV